MRVNYYFLLLGVLLCMPIYAQQVSVKGIVTDSVLGTPLPGVSVLIKGTRSAVSADFDGNYAISAKSTDVLVFSYVGYKTVEMAVGTKTTINVILAEESNQLNEVVVVGYGSVKKSDVIGAISTIKPETITERNAINPLEAIQGSTAGVQITSSTGRSGDGYNVVIRGNNSMISGATPLYVVDGVPTDNIDFLNPQDIARMDVLKDASSAAIYGSRGASGVILIATKSGTTAKSGMSVSLETSYGTKSAVRLPKMMSGAEWWKYHQVAYMNATPETMTPASLLTASSLRSPLLVERANSGYTFDWYDAVLESGMTANNYVNISGRAENGLSYNMAFGIQNDEGLIENDSNDKYSFKLGVNHRINDKFSTGANLTIARVETELGSDLAMQEAFRFGPLMSPYAIDADGNETNALFFRPGKLTYPNGVSAIDKTSTINPLLEIANSSQTEKSWKTIGNIYFEYQALDWLAFKTTFSAGVFNGVNTTAYGVETNAGATIANKNSASISNSQNFNYTWDNQIDLKHTFNEDHSVSALLLQSFYSNTNENSYLYSNDQPADVGHNNMGTGVQTSYQITSGFARNTLNSYAVRLNYGYKDKYLITASTRWDGSSVLSEGNKWTSFPSVGLGWNITKESFLEDNKTISNLKLRASFGYTGNDNVDPYSSQSLLDQQTFYANAGNAVIGAESKNLANANLTWEKTKELNFGLDFGFLANRITGSIDVYDRLSDKLIQEQKLPYETGWDKTYANVGSVSNKGIEIGLTTKNINSNLVDWETSFTFTKNINNLESIYGQDQTSDIGNNLILGSELNPNYNYIYDGIWQESQAAEAATYNMKPGQAKLKDLNDDGKFDGLDRAVIGNVNPEWQGSIYSKLRVGQFDLNFSILASQGQTVMSTFHQNFTNTTDRGRQKLAMDYFIPTNGAGIAANASNANPRPGPAATGAGSFWGSDMAYYRAVDYVKIKNISIGYNFDRQLLQKLKINSLRVYVNVLDPFVFTDFDGYDPEWAGARFGVNRPASVTTQLGLSIKF